MAKDIREDQMTTVGSVDYVRGLTGKNSALIKPEMLANATGCLFSRMVYNRTATVGDYYKIIKMGVNNQTPEGFDNSIALLIVGGNNYASTAYVTLLSACVHRGVVMARKNGLIGELEIGYVLADNTLSIWIKRPSYSHYVQVYVLTGDAINKLVSGESLSSAPDGYTLIK